jgi:uncharacterized caspase-like protein
VPESDTAVAEVSVPLPAGRDCVIGVLAEHRFAVSDPALLRIRRDAAPAPAAPAPAAPEPPPISLKPKLYLVAAGIDHYAHSDLLPDLHFAAKDAKDFAAALKRQEGGLYEKVEARVLTGPEATGGNLHDALDWIKHQATAKDVAVIFFSGHGENDEDLRYHFCAQDYDVDRRTNTGVSTENIRDTLRNMPGKVLFFIDSCHAGNALGKLFASKGPQVDVTGLVNELSGAENGVIVFTSSTGRGVSLELKDGENGAFTKALIEGLDGQADLLHNGKITVSSLETFVDERVKVLTHGRQTPTVTKPESVPDFPFAVRK